jgi:hypothetical protein
MERRLLRRQRPLRLVHKFEVGIARFCGAKEFAKMTKAVKQQSTKKGKAKASTYKEARNLELFSRRKKSQTMK